MKRREYTTLLVVAAGIWPSVRVDNSLMRQRHFAR
jgi:nitrate reductase NapE component